MPHSQQARHLSDGGLCSIWNLIAPGSGPESVRDWANAGGRAGEQDIAKGWIWFTVTNLVLPNGSAPALRKILWTP